MHILTRSFKRSLRKHPYSNILKILQTKQGKFSDKNSDIFLIFAQNIDCGFSLEPPHPAVLTSTHNLCIVSKIRKIMYTPVNPRFTIEKWGLRGSKLFRRVFVTSKSNESWFPTCILRLRNIMHNYQNFQHKISSHKAVATFWINGTFAHFIHQNWVVSLYKLQLDRSELQFQLR